MDNVVDFQKAKDDQQMDAIEAFEDEIRDSMCLSVAQNFVDKMVDHYEVNPALILMDIIGACVSRAIFELDDGNEAAGEIFAWLNTTGAELAEHMEEEHHLDFETQREIFLEMMYGHRARMATKH